MPNVQKVHVDKMLSTLSLGFKNEEFIADQVFQPVVVEKQSDRYYVYGKEMFEVKDDIRAPGTEANEINWTLSSDSYYCDGHAIRTLITDEEKQNADDVFQLEQDAVELVTKQILLNKEVDAAAKAINASSYSSSCQIDLAGAGNNKWDDYTNSNPILDLEMARRAVHLEAGLDANVLIISKPVYDVLKLHPKILGMYKNTERTIATMEDIKLALGVDEILVGKAKKTINAAGDFGYIWGKSAVLAYRPQRPGKKIQAFGYSFMWNKDGAGAVQVRQWYEMGRRTSIVEAERWYSQKIISNVAGYLLKNAIS